MLELIFTGYYQVQVCTSCMEQILFYCKKNHITLYALSFHDNEFFFKIKRSDYNSIINLFHKYHIDQFKFNPTGIFFLIQKYRKRYFFAVGAILFFAFLLYSEKYIWNIAIDGNYSISDEMVLDYLKERNIHKGCSKSLIKCDEEELQLRDYFQNVSWVSMSFNGTTLQISLKEVHDRTYSILEECSDIRASEDGTIISIITRKGVPCVKEGDNVSTNDLLICGQVPIFNEEQEIIAYHSYAADGDIRISVKESYHDFVPFMYQTYEKKKEKTFLYFIAPHIRINIFGFSNDHQNYRESYLLALPISNYYKVGFEKIKETPYILNYNLYSKDEVIQILEHNFQEYILCLQEKGVQIIEKNVKIVIYEQGLGLEGELQIIKNTGERVTLS